jgi:glycine dehydrogenase subunit 2
MSRGQLIFEKSKPGRCSPSQYPTDPITDKLDLNPALLRKQKLAWPEVHELEVVRHYTKLSQENFAIDTAFYPLGSCTMKYNPREVHRMASLPGFLMRHPLAELSHSQGFMRCVFELQEMLKAVTGMSGISLSPMAGAQGEFAGVLMIRAYHQARADGARTEMLVPDSAHGTNPASAVMCGYTVKELPTAANGDLDIEALKKAVGPQTAGIMLTNPSTLGLFERQIDSIANIVHEAGGLLYYDGANLNAILGKVRPGDMGFDVMHMNLHKTFATPHGGGGPGSGPIAVNDRLLPYLPIPQVHKQQEKYVWLTEKECPDTIGRLSTFMGNAGILLRAYFYMRLLGRQGLHRVGEYATLNANYLLARFKQIGLTAAYPNRRATHEFIITLKPEMKRYHLTAMDFAKRLLDFGIHAPTTYFPVLIPECWLIEPTETESKDTLDSFVSAMEQILEEAKTNPDKIKSAPHTLPVGRLDDIYAAKVLDVKYIPTHA